MGIIECLTHGNQDFFQVCEHIGNALRVGTRLHGARLLMFEVCDVCVELHQLARFIGQDLLTWNPGFEDFYNLRLENSTIHCAECIAAVELAAARAAGRRDPFVAYERTLTFLQRETVDRLRDWLCARFEFAQSIVEPKRVAMWVREGALTRPLEITIYYVVDPREQDRILASLETFFADISRNQYHVRFFRLENWIERPCTPPVISSFRRGPEEIVREHRANSPNVADS